MQKFKSFLFSLTFAVFALFLFSHAVLQATPPAEGPGGLRAQGRELFHSKDALGGKFACILCHKAGKAVKKSAVEALGDDDLAKVINQQLLKKAKAGAPLPADGPKMKALIAYLREDHIHGR